MKKFLSLLFFLVLVLFTVQCSSSGSSSSDSAANTDITETDFEESSTIALNADAQLNVLKQTAPTMDDARQQLVAWLLTQEGVTDAGIDEEDEKTVWFYHTSGLTSGILTENSFNNGSSDPLVLSNYIVSAKSSPKMSQAVSRAASTVTGMMAWLFSPFHTENIANDKINAIANIYKEPYSGMNFYEPFLDGEATIGAFGAALGAGISGIFPPAVHLTVISHGGRIRLNAGGPEVSFILSGEYETAATWASYGPDFHAERLVPIAYKGKLWLAMTPAFFEYYSGKPDPGDSHWMARYVHLLAPQSFKDNSLHDAFMNNGAQVFSGFSDAVDIAWGNNITLEYLQNLAKGEGQTIWEARLALSSTTDPFNSSCTFEHSAKTVDTRYFYRASVLVDDATYYTPAYAWTAVFHGIFNNGPGYYFSSGVFDETTGAFGGNLTIIFTSTSGGNVETDTVTKISFDDTVGNTWFVDNTQYVDKFLTGAVEVTTFDDRNGGQVIGSWDGILTNSITAPYYAKLLGGKFELIRNFNGSVSM